MNRYVLAHSKLRTRSLDSISTRQRASSATILLLSAVLLATGAIASRSQAEPVLLDPIFLPGDGLAAPAAGMQRAHAVARGGNQYLVVWEDLRSSRDTFPITTNSEIDIYAARLNADGHPIDRVSIPIATDRGDQIFPYVSWNGQNWLVAWQTVVPTEWYYTGAIVATRVSPDGVVLDDPPIPIYTFQHDSDQMGNVSSDGTNFLVVWKQVVNGATWSYRATRIAPNGSILDPGGVSVLQSTTYPSGPEIIFAQDQYLFVWVIDSIYGMRLSPSLQRIGGVMTIAQHPEYNLHPSLATDGSDYFVAYQRGDVFAGQIRGTRITHAGTVADPDGILLSGIAMYNTYARDPFVDWNGTDWLVAWIDDRATGTYDDIYVNRVTTAGVRRDGTGFRIEAAPGAQTRARVLGVPGGGTHIIFTDKRRGGPQPEDIARMFVANDLTVGVAEPVSLSLPAQSEPRLATGNDGYVVAFRTDVSGERRIALERVEPSGVPLWPEPIIVASGPNLESPSVAWSDDVLMVVWEDRDLSQVYGRRVASDGSFLDPVPISLMRGNTPDVAAQGDLFLVVASFEPTDHLRYPYGVRVQRSDGALLDPVPVKLGGSFTRGPRVGSLGANWLVVWQQNITHDDATSSIVARIVQSNGSLGSAFTVSTSASSEKTPDITQDANDALVVWVHQFGTNNSIRGRRVSADGTMPDEGDFVVNDPPGPQLSPAVSSDGAQWIVHYRDQRVNNLVMDERSDLYGARLSSSLEILDPEGFAIATNPDSEVDPDVASCGGNSLFAGTWFLSNPEIGTFRIALRPLMDFPVTGVDTDDATELSISGGPNPFHDGARFILSMPARGVVEANVIDVSGRQVRTLWRGELAAGTTELVWDGQSDALDSSPSGVYFLRVATPFGTRVLKLLRQE